MHSLPVASLLLALTLASGPALAECPLDLSVTPRASLSMTELTVHDSVLSLRPIHVPQTRRVLASCGYDEAADMLQEWKRGRFGAIGLGTVMFTSEMALIVLLVGAGGLYYEGALWPYGALGWPWAARDNIVPTIERAWTVHPEAPSAP